MISIILPTYNEAPTTIALLQELKRVLEAAGLAAEVIVVDDDSPDGTGDAVRNMFAGDAAVRLIVRRERGLATAIRTGLEAAVGDRLVVMDADFNHDPSQVPVLVGGLDRADVVVGSRFVRGGGTKESRPRYWGSYAFNLFVGRVLGTRIRDNLSGYFAIRRTVLRSLSLQDIFVGYGDYFIRLLHALRRRGAAIVEIPTVYGKRPGGRSKTRLLYHLLQYTQTVLDVRRRGRTRPPDPARGSSLP